MIKRRLARDIIAIGIGKPIGEQPIVEVREIRVDDRVGRGCHLIQRFEETRIRHDEVQARCGNVLFKSTHRVRGISQLR